MPKLIIWHNIGPILAAKNRLLLLGQCRRFHRSSAGSVTAAFVYRPSADTWPSIGPIPSRLSLLLWHPFLKVVEPESGTLPIHCRYWAKFRLKVGKFKQSKKAAVVGPALNRCKQWNWTNNNSRFLAAEIGPILCRIITFGNSHLGCSITNLKSPIRAQTGPQQKFCLDCIYNSTITRAEIAKHGPEGW